MCQAFKQQITDQSSIIIILNCYNNLYSRKVHYRLFTNIFVYDMYTCGYYIWFKLNFIIFGNISLKNITKILQLNNYYSRRCNKIF